MTGLLRRLGALCERPIWTTARVILRWKSAYGQIKASWAVGTRIILHFELAHGLLLRETTAVMAVHAADVASCFSGLGALGERAVGITSGLGGSIVAVHAANMASCFGGLGALGEGAVRVASGLGGGVLALCTLSVMTGSKCRGFHAYLGLALGAVACFASHGGDLLDFFGRAVGEVAWVGVLCGRHCLFVWKKCKVTWI